VARLPSGEVLKLDLRQAEFQRGGADGGEFVYASRSPAGPTFITDDADLHAATMVAWHQDHRTPAGHSAKQATEQVRRARLSRFQLAALVVGLAVIGSVLGAALLVGPLARVALRFVPRSVDDGIGREAYAHVLGRIGTERDDQAMREPVQTVLDRLVEAVPSSPFHFRVAICDSPMLNAFALPGGQMVLTTRMIAALDSAEELAAVLAHEMNHVLARHSMEMTIRTSGLRFLVHVASGGKVAAGVAMSVWSAIGVMGYSRDKERDADLRAVHLLVGANIDPQALLPMFGKLQAEEERHGAAPVEPSTQKMLEKFRTHPAIAQRIADVETEIAKAPPASPQPLDVDFAALTATARGERETTRPGL